MKSNFLLSSLLGLLVFNFGLEPLFAKTEIKDEEIIEQEVVTDDVTPRKQVGEKAASKYFTRKESARASSSSSSDRAHFLALHIGTFVDSDSYKWGVSDHVEDNGKLNMGLTYRMGQWSDTMDMHLRVDFISYDLPEAKPLKMSVIPLFLFPDADSEFPLYFGAGIGPGIFFKQVAQESSLTLDYQLVAGARAFDLIENTGFFIETGLKNHLNLLSDGQFNGVFIAGGAMFTF
ncbi:MAG: hypothetical protein AB7F59_14750 [Bdellovibrionales bacterium]